MNLSIIVRHQIRLFLKTPGILVLIIAAPLFLIFIFGQAFTGIWDKASMGFSAMDYFGITLLTLTLFNGAMVAAWGVSKERKSNTEPRLGIAPLRRGTVVWGTFLGIWVILTALSFILVFLARFVLSVDYGPSAAPVLLVMAGETLLAASLGVSASFLLPEKAANAILSTGVPLFCFLGGCYTMIPETGFLHDIAVVSPLRWVNLALLAEAAREGNGYTASALLFCVLLSVILMGLTGFGIRRKR